MIDADSLFGRDDQIAEQAIRSLNRTDKPIPDHAVLAVWEIAWRAIDQVAPDLLADFIDRYQSQLPDSARAWRDHQTVQSKKRVSGFYD